MFCRSHIKTLCLIPLFFLTISKMSHSYLPLIRRKSRGPYFIMGKNHAARETTCVLTFVWFLQKKPKIFTTACNTVRMLMMGKMRGKWIMSWLISIILYVKLGSQNVQVSCILLYIGLKSTMLLFFLFSFVFLFTKCPFFPFHITKC